MRGAVTRDLAFCVPSRLLLRSHSAVQRCARIGRGASVRVVRWIARGDVERGRALRHVARVWYSSMSNVPMSTCREPLHRCTSSTDRAGRVPARPVRLVLFYPPGRSRGGALGRSSRSFFGRGGRCRMVGLARTNPRSLPSASGRRSSRRSRCADRVVVLVFIAAFAGAMRLRAVSTCSAGTCCRHRRRGSSQPPVSRLLRGRLVDRRSGDCGERVRRAGREEPRRSASNTSSTGGPTRSCAIRCTRDRVVLVGLPLWLESTCGRPRRARADRAAGGADRDRGAISSAASSPVRGLHGSACGAAGAGRVVRRVYAAALRAACRR